MSLIFCTYQTLKNIFNSFLRLLPSTRSIDNFPENVFFWKKIKNQKKPKICKYSNHTPFFKLFQEIKSKTIAEYYLLESNRTCEEILIGQ